MNFLFVATIAFCIVHCSSQQPAPAHQTDLSDYFRSKHVINQGHIRRQLLSSKIPDSQKQQILQNYVGKQFMAQPNSSKPAERKPWRAALGGITGNTFILADQRKISSAVKNGIPDGVDSSGLPVTKTQNTFPMIKAKTKFGTAGSGSGPKKNIGVSFVKDGGPTIRHEHLRVSHLGNKINHFESSNKPSAGTRSRSSTVGTSSRRGSSGRGPKG